MTMLRLIRRRRGVSSLVLPFLAVCSLQRFSSSNALAIGPPLLDQLTSHAVSYASAHGLQVQASKANEDDHDDNDVPTATTNISTYECAPISLLPNAYPRTAFYKAQILARPFNLLVERLSQDGDFLVETLQNVGDPFTAKLLALYQDIYMTPTISTTPTNDDDPTDDPTDNPSTAKNIPNHAQTADRLGIQRSDYMLNENDRTKEETTLAQESNYSIQQVELNTIAASFGGLAVQVAALHRHVVSRFQQSAQVRAFLQSNKQVIMGQEDNTLLSSQSSPPQSSPPLLKEGDGVPFNPTLTCIPEAMDVAFSRYQKRHADQTTTTATTTNLVLLMVVQDGETNTVDQRLLEFRLWQTHQIPVVRLSLTAAHAKLNLNADTGALTIINNDDDDDNSSTTTATIPQEVAVVYFRAGYAPTDYKDGDNGIEWQARETMERSRATKCPCLGYHLAGTKKVQQALARPGVLEQFFAKEPDDAALMRSAFAGLYSLGDDAGPEDLEAVQRVLNDGQEGQYVLKPQREGGGYNFYGDQLADKLRENTSRDGTSIQLKQELSEYILMERLFPPQQDAILLRSGNVEGQGKSISELGCFGTIVVAGDDDTVVLNKYAGFLLRTKFANVDEGGVASGFATLSSPYLCSSD